jgi:hypothetical protein
MVTLVLADRGFETATLRTRQVARRGHLSTANVREVNHVAGSFTSTQTRRTAVDGPPLARCCRCSGVAHHVGGIDQPSAGPSWRGRPLRHCCSNTLRVRPLAPCAVRQPPLLVHDLALGPNSSRVFCGRHGDEGDAGRVSLRVGACERPLARMARPALEPQELAGARHRLASEVGNQIKQ